MARGAKGGVRASWRAATLEEGLRWRKGLRMTGQGGERATGKGAEQRAEGTGRVQGPEASTCASAMLKSVESCMG